MVAPVSRRTRALGFVRRLPRTSPIGAAAGAALLGICLIGAFADVIAPYDPLADNLFGDALRDVLGPQLKPRIT